VLLHPPYSFELASSCCYLFPQIKEQLKGQHFKDAVEVHVALKNALQETALHVMDARIISANCMNTGRMVF
jgi:hypothetical protein